MVLNSQFLKDILTDIVVVGPSFSLQTTVVDSRNVTSGSVFAALPGAVTDGHEYIEDALARGACGIIAQKKYKNTVTELLRTYTEASAVFVDDVGDALYQVAQAWRAEFSIPVIGITGSIGKTTTRHMIVSVLENTGKKCLTPEKNYNTRIGIALTLFRLTDEHNYAVMEIGISRRGEMKFLAKLAKPTMGVITCVAHSHTAGLGSLSDIAHEKCALFSSFSEKNIGIINGDQPELSGVSYFHPVVRFGYKTTNQVQARKIAINGVSTSFVLKVYGKKLPITLPTVHEGAVINALACASVTHLLGIDMQHIVAGIQNCKVVPGRFELRPLANKNGIVINDAYNANPESMRSALLAFERLRTKGAKVAVLGDMLELGINAAYWHRQIGRHLRKTPSIKRLVLVGRYAQAVQKSLPPDIEVKIAGTWQEAKAFLAQDLQENAAILVKASHGTGLENLVNDLAE